MTIYIIDFPNGKQYIGQTKNYKRRMKEHRYDSNRGKVGYLYNAIRKYGWINLKISTLTTEVESVDLLEQAFIAICKANFKCWGYNIENGGNYNKTLSSETKEKISNALKARHRTPVGYETKAKISNSLKGHKISEETKRKISMNHRGHPISEATRAKISESMKKWHLTSL